nr:MAG TPA: hypothetical protein [Caudoviricetes sp.]
MANCCLIFILSFLPQNLDSVFHGASVLNSAAPRRGPAICKNDIVCTGKQLQGPCKIPKRSRAIGRVCEKAFNQFNRLPQNIFCFPQQRFLPLPDFCVAFTRHGQRSKDLLHCSSFPLAQLLAQLIHAGGSQARYNANSHSCQRVPRWEIGHDVHPHSSQRRSRGAHDAGDPLIIQAGSLDNLADQIADHCNSGHACNSKIHDFSLQKLIFCGLEIADIVLALCHFALQLIGSLYQIIVHLHFPLQLLQAILRKPAGGDYSQARAEQSASQREEGHDYGVRHLQATSQLPGSATGPCTVASTLHR